MRSMLIHKVRILASLIFLALQAHMPYALGEDDAGDMQCVRDFYGDILHCEATTIEQKITGTMRQIGLLVREYYVNGDSKVWVSDSPKKVVYYTNKGQPCPVSNSIKCDTPEMAFEAADSIIRYHHLPLEQKQYDITRLDRGYGEEWIIIYDRFAADGIPYVGRNVAIYICPDTGMIRAFMNAFPISPEPCLGRIISKKKAIAKAKAWAQDVSKDGTIGWQGWIDEANVSKVRRVIVPIDDVTYKGKNAASDEGKAYHCWEIPVIRSGTHLPPYPGGAAFVRVDTGDVLGVR